MRSVQGNDVGSLADLARVVTRGADSIRQPIDNVSTIGEPLLTDIEAAPIVGLAVQTIRNDRLNRRLGIPFYRLGKSVRYKRSELEAWLAKHAVANEPEAA